MINKFDMLAKVALNEASLGDYIKAAGVMAARAGKSAAKSTIKGLAQLPGAAIKGAGTVYGALGGTQGAAAANKVGGAIQRAGLKAVTTPVQIWRNLKSTAEKQEYIRKNLPGVKRYMLIKTPILTGDQKRQLGKVRDFDELDRFVKDNIPGKTSDQLINGYNNDMLKKAESEAARKNATKITPQKTVISTPKPKQILKPKSAPSTRGKLKYDTTAPSPHTGQAAGTYNGKINPPPSGIKL